jgi:hypothetical protein
MKLKWLLILLLAVACSPATPVAPAQVDPPFPKAGPVGTTAHVYPVEKGWVGGQAVEYYNLGTNTPLKPDDPQRVLSSPVWLIITSVNADGSPNKLPGQDSLFEVMPGDAAYTDLWQAHFVTPTADYVPNSITSAEALQASGLKIEKQALFVNCPIVPPGSSLGDNAKPLVKGWVRDQAIVYFDFGPTSPAPGKVYAFITGFDSSGGPQLVPGQHLVFDSARAASGYSDFRVVQWVKVDSGYKADSIKSADDIQPESITASNIVVNYPQK